jgi:hypothetical protein
MAFLRSFAAVSAENLQFWRAVRDLKRATRRAQADPSVAAEFPLRREVLDIYDLFIRSCAPYEVRRAAALGLLLKLTLLLAAAR